MFCEKFNYRYIEMTSKVIYRGGLRNEATHLQSGAVILTDAPTDNHGKGEAFSPTDLVATALAGCMLTIMGIAAGAHGFNVDGAVASVEKVMGTAPRRIVEIKIVIDFPADYTDKQKRIIEASARECPVANSLHPELKQTITFNYKKA